MIYFYVHIVEHYERSIHSTKTDEILPSKRSVTKSLDTDKESRTITRQKKY